MKTVAIYPGRFQPFGPHHFEAYRHLRDKFGESDTFIATSNKVGPNSPLNFNEKKYIMQQYGIPDLQIIQVKNPYNPVEITEKYDPQTTRLVIMLGEKDAGRLRPGTTKKDGSPSYYQPFQADSNLPFTEHGYVVRAPHVSIDVNNYGEMSGTILRKFIVKADEEKFKQVFGWFKRDIFNMLKDKFQLAEAYFGFENRLVELGLANRPKKKVEPIQEIGDGSAGSYDFEFAGNLSGVANYEFSTDANDYKVEVMEDYGGIYVGFEVVDEDGIFSYRATNEFKKMFKVMGTITNIVKDHISTMKSSPRFIEFSSTSDKISRHGSGISQRNKLYLKYIKNQFPNARVEKHNYGVKVYLKENKNTEPIIEIGDGSAGSYEFKDQYLNLPVRGAYTFSTGTHDYTVNLSTSYDSPNYGIEVAFSVQTQGGHQSYGTTNNFRAMFKVMGTVTEIIKEFMRESKKERDINFSYIAFDSSTLKGDGDGEYRPAARKQRDKLYLKYIQSQFPNAKVNKEGSSKIRVDLKENKSSVPITEIGDGSAGSYKFKMTEKGQSYGEYAFSTEEHDYLVHVDEQRDGTELYITFELANGYSYRATNDFKSMFKVMGTITIIVKDYISKFAKSIKFIEFESDNSKASNKGIGRDQRNKLYVKYIKNQFPNSRFIKDPTGASVVAYLKENSHSNKKNRLMEGGGFGHMAHPFGEPDLTFKDLEELIERALSGELNVEGEVQEKMDGQNLMITYKDGRVKSSRNKSTLNNPMSAEELAEKFSNRGDVTTAFVEGMKDLENALQQIGDERLNLIFKNGYRFLNVEILFPQTQNVIKYGNSPKLILLGMVEFDDNWLPIKNYPKEAMKLAKYIEKANAKMQGTFEIDTPKPLDIPKAEDFSEKIPYFTNKLKKIVSNNNLSMSDTVGEYYIVKFNGVVDRLFPGMEQELKDAITKRWALRDKSYRMTKSVLGEYYDQFKDYEKNKLKQDYKKFQFPLEVIFLELGIEVMSNIQDFISTSPDDTVQHIRDEIAKLLRQARNTNDPKVMNTLRHNLEKIRAIGGFDKIIPAEGIVFNYKGKIMKLTGSFAPINQLLGIFRYQR